MEILMSNFIIDFQMFTFPNCSDLTIKKNLTFHTKCNLNIKQFKKENF